MVASETVLQKYRCWEKATRTEIPSARYSFLASLKEVHTPTKVFDAKLNFGAKGNGVDDDTEAVRKTIEAAEQHGAGCVAYFPAGQYVVSLPIQISGENYTVAGANRLTTKFIWAGPKKKEMSLFAVCDAQNVTIKHLGFELEENWAEIFPAIHQTSTGTGSFVTYDGINVPGIYWGMKTKRSVPANALKLDGLKAGDTVYIPYLYGNLHVQNCANAVILMDFNYGQHLQIEGKEIQRKGFIGIQFRLAKSTRWIPPYFPNIIKDNQSLVMSDYYMEQHTRIMDISGNNVGSCWTYYNSRLKM